MSEYIVELPDKPAKVVRDGWNVRIEWGFKQREEIVRCRDCKWYCEEWNRKLMRDTISCDWFDGAHVKPDGFCAWGERKD